MFNQANPDDLQGVIWEGKGGIFPWFLRREKELCVSKAKEKVIKKIKHHFAAVITDSEVDDVTVDSFDDVKLLNCGKLW